MILCMIGGALIFATGTVFGAVLILMGKNSGEVKHDEKP